MVNKIGLKDLFAISRFECIYNHKCQCLFLIKLQYLFSRNEDGFEKKMFNIILFKNIVHLKYNKFKIKHFFFFLISCNDVIGNKKYYVLGL